MPDGARACPKCGTPHEDSRLEDLLERYVEQRIVDGSAADPEELCRESPELAGALREHIEEFEKLTRRLAPPDDRLAGTTLLHYRIVEKLGQGGMGEVYLAEDTKLGRRVALKVLPPEMAGDPERFRRFQREARMEAKLNHPNVVTVYSVEEAEGLAFLTMELVEGETLRAKIGDEGVAAEELLGLAVQLADALAAAHSRGVMHRDLKPANVMVDGDGRLKVLDFGLAKLRPPPAGGDGSGSSRVTTDGKILGTLPYMSPEQIQGEPVDLRTDVFSFGVVLYEMATGRRPFRGRNMAELISTILRDTPEPVSEINPRLPHPLEGIVGRCLEKDPAKRFPTAVALRNELRALRRQLAGSSANETWTVPTVVTARPRRRARQVTAALLVALALAAVYAGVERLTGSSPREPPTVAEPSGKTSVAVLFFQNTATDEELDWLRTGLTDILVTDLSQSPELDVVATDRLYGFLRDLGADDEEAPSSELLAELAERAGVDTVLEGGFLRNGDELRIHLKLRHAATGAIVTGDQVAGRFETDLFSMVDGLSRAIRGHLEVPQRGGLAASVKEITTFSVEALRYYSEGTRLFRQAKEQEAIPLFEKAISLDPGYATALLELGTLHRNLGHAALSREYTQRAMEHADRLPIQSRHFAEGKYYSSEWKTYGRAIDTLRTGLDLYPDNKGLRGTLAELYTFLERYEEAVGQYQELIDQGSDLDGTYVDIATVHAAMGRFETGYRILAEFAGRHPDNWFAQNGLGWHLIRWGRLEEAFDPLRRAGQLRPGEILVHNGLWRLQVLREDWAAAASEAGRMVELRDSYARWRGLVCAARTDLFGGRSREALARLAEAAHAYREPDAHTGLSRCWTARLLLQKGDPARALAEAQQAQREAPGEWPELEGMFLEALAQQALGRPAEADRLADALSRRAAASPNVVEERQLHHLKGRLALARDETERAVEEVKKAAALLPPRGIPFHWHALPDHVPLWYALGEAELAAGRDQEARDWFQRVAGSGVEHIEHPVLYVRSVQHLGKIHQRLGDRPRAAAAYERFLRYWRDGDLDRPEIREAELFH